MYVSEYVSVCSFTVHGNTYNKTNVVLFISVVMNPSITKAATLFLMKL